MIIKYLQSALYSLVIKSITTFGVLAAFLALPSFSKAQVSPEVPVKADLATVLASRADGGARSRIVKSYDALPLAFEANRGQTDAQVKFLSRGNGYTLFLTEDGAVLALRGAPRARQVRQRSAAESGVLRMKLAGTNQASSINGINKLPGKSNYFIGNDPAKWRTNVPSYGRVEYQDVYPGIDLVYYGNQGQLEYDFDVAPGADPGLIRLALGGGTPRIAANGDLVVRLAGREVRLRKPLIYQPVSAKSGGGTSDRQVIAGHYRLTSHEVRFEIPSYDRSRPVVIDPVLAYSTYLGGNGLDKALGITVTSGDSAIVVGSTFSTNFPTTAGAYQTLFGGGPYDAFVTEFSPNGESLGFSTYLGGTNDDESWGVKVDSSGNVYVSGHTDSMNFPTTSNAYHTSFFGTGYDCFLSKLNSTGSALIYSTYIAPVDPGPTNEHNGDFMTASSSGRAAIVGPTNYASFPTTPGAFQTTYGGGDDAFLVVLDTTKSGSASLDYSTYLGGSSNDVAQEVTVDSVGNAYIVGTTHSLNFPVTTGAYQTSCKLNSEKACSGDIFLTKISPHGKGAADLLYSTYFGGTGADSGVAIAIDSTDHAYITGDTQSSDLPTTPGAFQTACDLGTGGTCEDSYIAKFSLGGKGTADLTYSTYFGGTGTTLSKAVGVDSLGNAYVDGRTTSTNFPVVNPIQAAHAPDNGNYDSFVTELNASGSALIFSTYIGSNNFDSLNALALDSSANIFIGGRTQGTNYPATAGAFGTAHTSNGGLFNVVAGEITPANGVGVAFGPASLTFGTQLVNTTSPAQTVTVLAAGNNALSISSIVASSGFAQTNTCTSTVSGGGTCSVSVTFDPSVSGTINGTLKFTDNGPSSPQTLNVTGVGTFVQVSPSTLSFGNQAVGTTSPAKKITLTNKGSTTLSITKISITGADPGDFAETNTCGSSVAAGASCSISVTFTPTATGSRTASLTISDSDAASPQTVSLSGTGT
jgi:hypothetical protein